jgi:DNA-binding transcriptional regulator YdaS (Cro superfamily)
MLCMKLSDWLKEQPGRGRALADAVGVPQSFVSKMASGAKQPPAERCASIERATAGVVTRADLRPADYLDIWPELAHPATPQPTGPATAGVA